MTDTIDRLVCIVEWHLEQTKRAYESRDYALQGDMHCQRWLGEAGRNLEAAELKIQEWQNRCALLWSMVPERRRKEVPPAPEPLKKEPPF